MQWWNRPGVVYGFAAGAVGGCVVVLGVLLIKFDLARYEHLPPDAHEVGTQHPVEPAVRDTYSTGSEPKSSLPTAKVSPSLAPGHPQRPTSSAPGVTDATGTATQPPGTPTQPPGTPSRPPVPMHTAVPPIVVPVLPGVKVTIPPIIRLPRL